MNIYICVLYERSLSFISAVVRLIRLYTNFFTNYMFVVNILYLLCTSLDSFFYRYKFCPYNCDICVPLQSANECSKYIHEIFLFPMINLGTIKFCDMKFIRYDRKRLKE